MRYFTGRRSNSAHLLGMDRQIQALSPELTIRIEEYRHAQARCGIAGNGDGGLDAPVHLCYTVSSCK
jgi:DICT domain-containing protein